MLNPLLTGFGELCPYVHIESTTHAPPEFTKSGDVDLWETILGHGNWCEHSGVVQERGPLIQRSPWGRAVGDKIPRDPQQLAINQLGGRSSLWGPSLGPT